MTKLSLDAVKLVSCNDHIFIKKLIYILTDNEEEEEEEEEEAPIPNHMKRNHDVRENPNLPDKYYTSEKAVLKMIKIFLKIFGEGATLWDCCAGQDTPLSAVMRGAGFNLIENDLYGGGEDFLTMEVPPGVTGIVSNFPYCKVC